MPARRGKSKKSKLHSVILHAKVTRLPTDSAGNIDADLVERLSKVLDIAKQPGTSEDEAKCALRFIARMLSSADVKKPEIMSLDSAKKEVQRSSHSCVKISRHDGKRVAVEVWIHELAQVFKLALNVKYFHTGKGFHDCVTITFYGLRTNVAAAAMSFEAIFNLALIWAANHPSKNCYLLGLSSSIKRSAEKEIKLEEARALESEKRLIESLHRETLTKEKYQAPNSGSKESLAKFVTISDGEEEDVIFMGIKQVSRHTKKHKNVKQEYKDEAFINIKQEEKDDSAHEASEKQAKFEQKLEEEIETSGWQNHAKLMAFRQMAIRSAEKYFAKKWEDKNLNVYKSYRGHVHDLSAYEKGRDDAEEVDIKRRRLEAA